ncbi:hypothetical protein HY491_01220 [Candidatus Woesearchaeota archaeon]|nr:hypothetical protein [Candidatus Woesearchaeota archaeon]
MHDVCGRCHGTSIIALGVLVLINQYWLLLPWWTFIGAVLVLKGLLSVAKPGGCGHPMMDMPRKRR